MKTAEFRTGAQKALNILLDNQVQLVILQSRSPSCGAKKIYDGTFSGTTVPGKGIFAKLLEEHGIETIDAEDL